MYAIVRIGGKQYRAEEGRALIVEKLAHEVGDKFELQDVLLISDGEATQVGQPSLPDIRIDVEVAEQFKGKKITVFKYKPKIRYRRKSGHRQNYTRLMVNKIAAAGGDAPKRKKSATKKSVAKQAPEES